jgi:light-regulated signal transduction histidine kinase (bacteriophytochrome)
VNGSGAHVSSWSFLLRGIVAAFRLEIHLSPCPNFPGRLWLDLVVPDQRDEMAAYLSGIVAGPHDFDKEYRIRRKTDGAERWVAGLGKVERDATGRGVRMIGTIRDITETIRIQQELRSKAEELARSNADLEQFAYVASHDLREPLRMVNAYVSLLDRRYGERFDDEAREFLAFAREGATRMDALVLDLLAYSRIGRVVDSAVPVPLGQVVEAAIRHLAGKIDAAAARVEVAPDLPMVIGRVSEMIRLFQNLIDNAVKYRAPDRPPVIRISWRATDSQWIVTVADNGLGIAPEYFDRIFVIFQRLHRQPEYEGTGIGLAICKKIVEQHGGSIGLESRVGAGSAFHVSLPRTGAPSAGQNKGRPR